MGKFLFEPLQYEAGDFINTLSACVVDHQVRIGGGNKRDVQADYILRLTVGRLVVDALAVSLLQGGQGHSQENFEIFGDLIFAPDPPFWIVG